MHLQQTKSVSMDAIPNLDKMRFVFFLLLLSLTVTLLTAVAASESNIDGRPNPIDLLEGVKSVRAEMPASVLEGSIITTTRRISNISDLVMRFDGNRRVFSDVLNDEVSVRLSFDGDNIIRYDEGNIVGSVTINDLEYEPPEFLFDPRLLGIIRGFYVSDTLDSCIPIDTAQDIHLIGKNEISGEIAWGVRVLDQHAMVRDYWIVPDNNFKVVSHSVSSEYFVEDVVSKYENPDYPWLPSRVEMEKRDSGGNITLERLILIDKATSGRRLSDVDFSISGLAPAVGAEVFDRRSNTRLGYWDGDGGFLDAVPPGGFDASNSILYVLIAAILLVPGVILFLLYSTNSK